MAITLLGRCLHSVLFPGCLFIPLFLIGWGNSTLWWFFFVVWVICTLWLGLLAVPNLVALMVKKPPLFQTRRVLRLLAIVVTIPLAFYVSLKSGHTANAYAIDVAQAIQSEIDGGGVCPESIHGWERSTASHESKTSIGKYGAQYKVVYRAYPGLNEFAVCVIHSRDWIFCVEGGQGKTLEARLKGKSIPLDHYRKIQNH